MAATKSVFPFLIISILSFSATETVAAFINPLAIPSCTGHPSMLKCAHDVQSAIVGAGTGTVGIGTGSHSAVSVLVDSIIAAKSSYANVLHFLSCNHVNADFSVSLKSAVHIAIQELNQTSKVLLGKSTLPASEIHDVQKFLDAANRNLTKFTACLKHPNSNIDLSLSTLIDQSINLTVLSLKIFAQLCGKVSVGLVH